MAVAVSGGPDSLALTLLADRWVRERGGEVCALTVDHRLRPESGAEIRQLRAWLSTRAIRHEVLVWSGEKPTSGLQEAARIARYRLLDGWCREHGCLHLLTAHHGDDQIETHLIRRRAHSGPDGLAGMSGIRELAGCRVLRPLLAFPKKRLVAFLEAEEQPFITDPSNLNPAFERARLRRTRGVIPPAVELSDPRAAIRRLGTLRAAREHDLSAPLVRSFSLHSAGFAVFDPSAFLAIPPEMAERILSALVGTVGGAGYPARREGIARLRGVLGSAAKCAYTLGGCRFVPWRERVLALRELASAAEPVQLTPGEQIFWDRRFKVAFPPSGRDPLTIGYLGPAGVAQLNRLSEQRRQRRLPRLLFPTLPAAWDNDEIVAVPHLGYLREGIGAVPRFILRPANPLTRAGFVVV